MTGQMLLFPGQGSQEKGMGRDLAEHNSEIMELWKKAEKISKLPLREICWDGDQENMSPTNILQPALTVVNLSLLISIKNKINPIAASGHSLGEFSALVATGILSIDDVLATTSLRGKLMAEADPNNNGSMAAILKLSEDKVKDIVKEVNDENHGFLIVANYNTPSQFVVSGDKNAVNIACQKAKEQKGRGLELKVSGAFHSPMMKEANKEFAILLNKCTWNNAKFPLYSNIDGKPVIDAEKAKENILNQMISSVLWIDTMKNSYNNGIRSYLELGPKSVLSKMVSQCLSSISNAENSIEVKTVTNLEDIGAY